ncbi:MAG: DNA methyltransferase, partial [Candidatus Acidiferrales bacterium]
MKLTPIPPRPDARPDLDRGKGPRTETEAAPAPIKSGPTPRLPEPVFHDPRHHVKIFHGDCLEILAAIPEATVDLIFADPPYFLSNDGITCHAGRMVSVNKGQWDRSRGIEDNHKFNLAWLQACQRLLKPNGAIWVSGTA